MKNLKEFNSFMEDKQWIAKAVEGGEGKLRKQLGVKKGETLTKSRISSEIKDLEAQDTDKEKEGTQLPPAKAKKFKRLHLAKNLMKLGEGDNEPQNYMFFGNISNIKRMCDEILEMDTKVIDDILIDGHGWATDHIATSKDDVTEVYDFLKSKMDLEFDDNDAKIEVEYEDDSRGLISDGENC